MEPGRKGLRICNAATKLLKILQHNGSSIIGKESGVGVWTEKQADYKGVIIREFWGVVIPGIFKVSL